MQIVDLLPMLHVLTEMNKRVHFPRGEKEGSYFQKNSISLLSYEKSVMELKPEFPADRTH